MTLIQKITDKVQNLPLEANPSQKDIDNYYLNINNLIQIADEFAIGFAEWCIKKRIDFFDSTEIGETYTIDGNVSKYKMSELLEIYKDEKGL